MLESNTVLGILAHVDAGKTTLSEQMLYQAGVLRTPGRVDARTAFLDQAEIERKRGITVFSGQADFSMEGRSFSLIDTPGHVDFSGEMERCLRVLDCAVLVVSCAEGVQAHTETLWRLLNDASVPVFVFLNKTDRAGADLMRVFGQLERLGGNRFVPFFSGIEEDGQMEEETAELLAGLDDSLLERYLETGYDRELWLKEAKNLVRERWVFPVFSGSALNGTGVEELLRGLRLLAPAGTGNREAPFAGRAYQVRHDRGGRVVFLKVEQGTLHPKELLTVPGGEREKCNELRRYSGSRYELIQEAGPGMLCAVTGIRQVKAGDLAGVGAERAKPFVLQPLLRSQVLFSSSVPAPLMLSRFRELEDEEPLLGVEWRERTQELEVRVMGEVQLEALEEIFRERYSEQISFGPCSVLYQETIAAPVVGCGHFEPLRHYAEVHLRLEPGQRGSGIVFASECPLDFLGSNWQNLIRTHVLEKQHTGVLTGAPLTDVKITLLSGRAHLKHTEGGDFREAVYRAVRQGLMQAETVLLEPWYRFFAEVEFDEAGRVQSDLLRMGGECGAPLEVEGKMALRGRAPIRTMMGYPREFTAFTRGKGRLSLEFGGYEPCRDAAAIVEKIGYDPERDVENSPDSVFCSHGAGFPVKWNEANAHMHLPVEKIQG